MRPAHAGYARQKLDCNQSDYRAAAEHRKAPGTVAVGRGVEALAADERAVRRRREGRRGNNKFTINSSEGGHRLYALARAASKDGLMWGRIHRM